MSRNVKVVGLAITAVMAMSAFWAASAQAVDPELHCTSTTANCQVTATEINTHTYNIEGGNIRCRTSFAATIPKTSGNSIAGVNATYTNCRQFGVASTVNMNSCTYTFANVAASSPATANVSIVCPGGGSIVWNAPSIPCTTTYGPQTGLAHVVFGNSASRTEPTDVIANFTVSGLNYNLTGAGCSRTGNFRGGTWNGESTLEGFNDNAPGAEGTQVGLHVKPL